MTRPDISQTVHKMAQFSAQPTVEQWKLVKRILRYVQGRKSIGLLYTTEQDSSLVAYSDADYAGDVNDRKSTSGFVFLKNGAAISWRSKKQSVVAQSTAEAEYVALFYTAQQCSIGHPYFPECSASSEDKTHRSQEPLHANESTQRRHQVGVL